MQAIEKANQVDEFVKNKLGKSHSYQDIRTFVKENFLCPKGCPNITFYEYTAYFTKDKQKKVLSLKCVYCNETFYVYQESSHE